MALGDECSNDGFDDRWSCPNCYAGMANTVAGVFQCDECNETVECTVEQQPRSVSRIIYAPALAEEDHNGPFDDGEPKPGEDCLGTEPMGDMSAFARELDRD